MLGDVLEIGVFHGASLAAWREWLPEALVVGVDLFERVAIENVRENVPDDVKLIKGDSTQAIPELEGMQFKNIIDDGCHYPLVQAKTLVNIWRYLENGGHYFIEDFWDINSLDHPWAVRHREGFNRHACMAFERILEDFANDGATILVHDFRSETGEPDSCIVELIRQ